MIYIVACKCQNRKTSLKTQWRAFKAKVSVERTHYPHKLVGSGLSTVVKRGASGGQMETNAVASSAHGPLAPVSEDGC